MRVLSLTRAETRCCATVLRAVRIVTQPDKTSPHGDFFDDLFSDASHALVEFASPPDWTFFDSVVFIGHPRAFVFIRCAALEIGYASAMFWVPRGGNAIFREREWNLSGMRRM